MTLHKPSPGQPLKYYFQNTKNGVTKRWIMKSKHVCSFLPCQNNWTSKMMEKSWAYQFSVTEKSLRATNAQVWNLVNNDSVTPSFFSLYHGFVCDKIYTRVHLIHTSHAPTRSNPFFFFVYGASLVNLQTNYQTPLIFIFIFKKNIFKLQWGINNMGVYNFTCIIFWKFNKKEKKLYWLLIWFSCFFSARPATNF